MTVTDGSPLPIGSAASRQRYVKVPAGSVVLLLTADEWANLEHVVEERLQRRSEGRGGLGSSLGRVLAKLRECRSQIVPPST